MSRCGGQRVVVVGMCVCVMLAPGAEMESGIFEVLLL